METVSFQNRGRLVSDRCLCSRPNCPVHLLNLVRHLLSLSHLYWDPNYPSHLPNPNYPSLGLPSCPPPPRPWPPPLFASQTPVPSPGCCVSCPLPTSPPRPPSSPGCRHRHPPHHLLLHIPQHLPRRRQLHAPAGGTASRQAGRTGRHRGAGGRWGVPGTRRGGGGSRWIRGRSRRRRSRRAGVERGLFGGEEGAGGGNGDGEEDGWGGRGGRQLGRKKGEVVAGG